MTRVEAERGAAGKRKAGLDRALSELLGNIFAGRILAFDEAAAEAYANLMSRASRAAHALSVGDAQIAAIATTRTFIVAARDTTPFVAAGVTVINPWKAGVEQRAQKSPDLLLEIRRRPL
jgi:predicted nucleic acid-binding protein